MTIETWMPTLTENMGLVAGIEQAHDYSSLPGSLQVFPCIVVLPVSGTQTGGKSAPGISLHQVQITLYTGNQVLPEAMGVAVPFIELIRDAIYADVTLSGNCAHCLPRADGTFYEGPGAIRYAGQELCGIAFYVTIKEVESLTVS